MTPNSRNSIKIKDIESNFVKLHFTGRKGEAGEKRSQWIPFTILHPLYSSTLIGLKKVTLAFDCAERADIVIILLTVTPGGAAEIVHATRFSVADRTVFLFLPQNEQFWQTKSAKPRNYQK